jgi:hypothetical protein
VTRAPTPLLLALLALCGCSRSAATGTATLSGRPIGAEHAAASGTPPPTGDPPPERHGTLPARLAAQENAPATGSLAPSPQAALRRYALAYTNWSAAGLVAHERQLAALAVGPARLAAEQLAAAHGTTAGLLADQVHNTGVVLAIAAGEGPDRGQWIVVTWEQTTGRGPYTGLPAAPHVTEARVAQHGQGWAVSEWRPKS